MFNLVHRLANKSFWSDALMYSFSAVLVATALCYGIFFFKGYLLSQKIGEVNAKIASFGTLGQKLDEKKVLDAVKSIDDFTAILGSHKISSNIFKFIEDNTLPKVWFSNFNMAGSTNEIRLTGESETMEDLSRQIQVFEGQNEYVVLVSSLNSQIVSTSKVKFVITMTLQPGIFKNYGN